MTVTPGVGSLTISWSAPSDGGAAITGYRVESAPLGRFCASTSTSCTVSGIDDETRWRFSVTARNRIGAGSASPWTTPLHDAVVLVVAGQSNATGAESYAVNPRTRASIFDGASPADSRVPFSFAGPYWHPASIPPGVLRSPQISLANHARVLFGPEVALARGLWSRGHTNVLVEKVVANGTSLAVDWRPHGHLFNELVQRTTALMAWAAKHGSSPSIGGVFWVQGEADAEHAAQAATYGVNLVAFIAALRAALASAPHAPFVLALTTIAPWVHYAQHHGGCGLTPCASLLGQDAEVRAAQSATARSVHDVYRWDTAGLPRTTIQLHLSSVGELDLGAGFAAVAAEHLT